MSTLYLIRHGQASFGKADYDVLSEKGKTQAEYLAKYLYESGIICDVVYTGPPLRHTQTAQPFVDLLQTKGRLPVQKEHPGLAEYRFENILEALLPIISAEDKSFNTDIKHIFTDNKAFYRVFEAAVMRWIKGTDTIPGATWQEFKSRVNAGIEEIMAEDGSGKHVAIFTSGGPIALIMQKALQLSDEITMQLNWQIINCSITRFKCTSDRIMVSAFNEHTWLKKLGGKDMLTYR